MDPTTPFRNYPTGGDNGSPSFDAAGQPSSAYGDPSAPWTFGANDVYGHTSSSTAGQQNMSYASPSQPTFVIDVDNDDDQMMAQGSGMTPAIEGNEGGTNPEQSSPLPDIIANWLTDEVGGLVEHKNEYLRSGSRHPFIGGSKSYESLHKALKRVVFNFTRPMMEEVMLEGNIFHSRLMSIEVMPDNPHIPPAARREQPVRRGIDAYVSIQRLNDKLQPSVTIRWTDKVAQNLGPQKYRFMMHASPFCIPARVLNQVMFSIHEPRPPEFAPHTEPPMVKWTLTFPTKQAAEMYHTLFDETQSRWKRICGQKERREREAAEHAAAEQAAQQYLLPPP